MYETTLTFVIQAMAEALGHRLGGSGPSCWSGIAGPDLVHSPRFRSELITPRQKSVPATRLHH